MQDFSTVLVVIMGVSGSGKTTLGRAVSTRLGYDFVDADDLHSAATVERMRDGVSLSSVERDRWMDRVVDVAAQPTDLVIACSGLRAEHRGRLRRIDPSHSYFLEVPPEELERRLRTRTGHFFPATLLAEQLRTLEAPSPGEPLLVLDGTATIANLVESVLADLAHLA